MSVEQAILETVRQLPESKQREILEHAKRLREGDSTKPRRSGKGLWAGLGINLSADEIDQNQREIWKAFSRNDACCRQSLSTLTPFFGI
jgi:hypothetical protein